MRRIRLGLLLALTAAPATMTTAAAAQADRTDRIPYSVGPADFHAYHVNATGDLPPGLTPERWTALAKRTIERWGGTYLGTTTALPYSGEDGLNVIGFTGLSEDSAGLNVKTKSGRLVAVPRGGTCESVAGLQPTERVVTATSSVRKRLRADVVRRGKARRRHRTVTRSVTTRRVVVTHLPARRCVSATGTPQSDRASVRHDSDIRLQTYPSAPWNAGPEHPEPGELDLETVLLHELGHSAGLDHQPQDCDPSTPMRPSLGTGELWRGLDEVVYGEPCLAPYPVTPDPPAGPEPPFAGASLAGRAFHVNPAVPAGYDGERFVALARSVVERWGGTFAGVTDAKPMGGDGRSVIGFDTIADPAYEATTRSTTELTRLPAHRTCAVQRVAEPVWTVQRATKRVRVRVKGRRRTLRLRRDRLVLLPGPMVDVPTGSCPEQPAREVRRETGVEMDLALAGDMHAFEMGPRHPVQRTRFDMATLLALALGELAGAPAVDRCADASTPVTTELAAGDWWRSPTDVSRMDCQAAPAARAAAAAADEAPAAGGRVRHVLVRE